MTGKKNQNGNGEGTVYQRKDGRWEGAAFVLTTAGTRKRVRVYGRTRKEARDKLTEKIAQSNKGVPVASTKHTVGGYLAYWLEYVAEPKVRPTTYTSYESLVRLYLIPGLGSKKLARLSVRDIRAFLATVRETCQCCAQGKDAARPESKRRCCAIGECCKRYPSDRTVRFLLVLLRAALQQAVRDDEIPRNVARNVEMSMGTRREMEPLSAAEGRKLLKTARGDRLHALYEIAIRLGLRRGEVLGLRWRDVDLDAGTLSVRQTLQRVGGRLIFAPPKTARSRRTIALPTECVDVLKARRKAQGAERLAAGSDWAPEWKENELIFTTRNGTPIEPRNLNRSFASLLTRAGLRQVRFHDLRHTCASLLHERGEDARTIMEVLGHSSIRVTMDIYTFVRLDAQRSAIDRLGELLRDESDETDDDDGDDPPAAVMAG